MPLIKASDSVCDISVIFLRVYNGQKRNVSVHTGIQVIFTKRIVHNFSSAQKTVLIVNIQKFLVKSLKWLPNYIFWVMEYHCLVMGKTSHSFCLWPTTVECKLCWFHTLATSSVLFIFKLLRWHLVILKITMENMLLVFTCCYTIFKMKTWWWILLNTKTSVFFVLVCLV